jgi:hypothetical protein
VASRALDALSTAATDRYGDCLSASWLSARLGVDVARIDVLRRSGELIGVRPEGAIEWLYPAWQFAGREPRPVVRQILAAARDAGLDERRLYDVMTLPLGLGARREGKHRLADLVVAGADDQVVAAVRAAARR